MYIQIFREEDYMLERKVNEFINDKECPKKIIDIKFTSDDRCVFAAMVIYEYIDDEGDKDD